jgi:hypothetical protein
MVSGTLLTRYTLGIGLSAGVGACSGRSYCNGET